MSLLGGNVADIPLRCSVCPKKPDFSDVSHLLTHVSSKGHLSAEHKLRIRDDDASKEAIEDYDDWVETYNIKELVRERLNQKEKKSRSGGATSRRSSTIKGSSSRRTPASYAAKEATRRGRQLHFNNALDPQLNRRLASESISRSMTPTSAYDPSNFPRAFAHTMVPDWASQQRYSGSPLTIKQESIDSEEEEDDDDESYELPRRTPRHRRQKQSMSNISFMDDDLCEEPANEEAKLKGTYWEGMGLFDSATADMKRKRNQKKHVSVLRALEMTSASIEPSEVIYDMAGTFCKEREITGHPASDDLLEGESAPESDGPVEKKKRTTMTRRQTRQPLAKKDRNNGRVTRNRAPTKLSSRIKREPYYGDTDEEDEQLTYQPRSKKRATISIHRDNTGPDITFDSQPPAMQYLTAGYRNPLHYNAQHATFGQHAFANPLMPRTHSRQPSWNQISGGTFRPTGPGYGSSAFTGSGHAHNSQPFAANTNANANANANAMPAFAAYQQHQQQLGLGQLTGQNDANPLFQTNMTGNLWEMFGLTNDPADSVISGNDNGFQLIGDATTNNPFLLSDQKAQPEDDEGTISATSEH